MALHPCVDSPVLWDSWPFCSTMCPISALSSPRSPRLFSPLSNSGSVVPRSPLPDIWPLVSCSATWSNRCSWGGGLPVHAGRIPLVDLLGKPAWSDRCGSVHTFTMTLKFACENNKSTRWIAVLLGPESPAESIPPVSKKGPDLRPEQRFVIAFR